MKMSRMDVSAIGIPQNLIMLGYILKIQNSL